MSIITADAAGAQRPIPHEDGQTMTFREIPWRTLDVSQDLKERQMIEKVAAIAADLPKTPPGGGDDPRTIYEKYDKKTILEAGIGAWSYQLDVTPETIAQLDHLTAEWAFREILDLNMVSKSEGEG